MEATNWKDLMEEAVPFTNGITEAVLEDVLEFDTLDDAFAYLNNVVEYGVISGIVSKLIYVVGCHEFADEHWDELMDMVKNLEFSLDDLFNEFHDIKIGLAYAGYEVMAGYLLNEMEMYFGEA